MHVVDLSFSLEVSQLVCLNSIQYAKLAFVLVCFVCRLNICSRCPLFLVVFVSLSNNKLERTLVCWYANEQLVQSIQVYYLGQNVSLSEFRTKNCLAEWISCFHELMIVLLPFTSLVLEMPNMVCFVRTNSLINLVHLRKFGSCLIASACLYILLY
jgi:hypothetical protein